MRHISKGNLVLKTDYSAVQSDVEHDVRHSVYFCGVCYHVLMVKRYTIDVEEIKRILNYDCPSCDNPILKNLNYREDYLPGRARDSAPYDFEMKNEVSEHKVIFQPATVFQGLVSRVSSIDRYVGELKPGWFSIFYGSKFSTQLAERYCVRSNYSVSKECGNATTFFIDAGNSFDPYFIASLARQQNKNPVKVLDNIIISRVFTCYELMNLVSELPKLIEEYGVNLVIVSDILALFNDDIKRVESETILRDIRCRIMGLCKSRKINFITTISRRNKELEHLVVPYSDVLIEFKEKNHSPHVFLHRHPSNSSVDFQVKKTVRRCTLDNFTSDGEVCG